MFALVHGAWGGAWSWERVVPELERLGHETLAVELPCDDPEAGCTRYADVVLDALADAGDDVVLVGHSLAGLTIPLVAARRPLRRLVYLCSLLPLPGLAWVDQPEPALREGFTARLRRDELGRSYWPDAESVATGLYPDCPREAALAAFPRLRRQARAPMLEPCPLASLPDVESTYLLARADHAVSPAWSRRAARERLGVEPVELPGGHSPTVSRPGELAAALAALT